MDLKFSLPLIFWFILRMIQEKHWEYNAMATESRESMACNREKVCWNCFWCVWGQCKIIVCIPDLLYSEWGAYFLPPEDYGPLSQDFRQLEGIQSQQFTGITDHWKTDKDAENTFLIGFTFPDSHYTQTHLAWWWSALLRQSWTQCFPTGGLPTAA